MNQTFLKIILASWLFMPLETWAADPAPAPVDLFSEGESSSASSSADEADEDPGETPVVVTHKRSKRGSSKREKQAEGTKARNRFETDTVIKSEYSFDGSQLEVDPD